MKKIIIPFLLFFIVHIDINGCTCDYSLSQDLKDSKYIFVVRVLDILDSATFLEENIYDKKELDSVLNHSGYRVKVEIIRSYKKKISADTIIIAGDRLNTCSQEFFNKGIYLVFLSRSNINKMEFYTSNCNHNKQLTDTSNLRKKPEQYFRKEE